MFHPSKRWNIFIQQQAVNGSNLIVIEEEGYIPNFELPLLIAISMDFGTSS